MACAVAARNGRIVTMDENQKWAGIKRLATLNANKELARLSALDLEESARLFEELCTLFHAEFEEPPRRKEHPVGLIKYWKKT